MIFSKIKEAFSNKFNNIFKSHEDIDEIIDEIEELLILSDVGMKTTSEICNKLRKDLLKEDDTSKEHVIELLKEQMVNILTLEDAKEFDTKKNVILVVGVNGVGKTTSIAKISNIYKKLGNKVLLAAGDTFRAGAREQLELWAEVAEVECVSGIDGQDPASVIFEASKKYTEDGYDTLICDTAGRLHNKKNLMDEIEKIKKTIDRNIVDVDTEVLMVIDATTGQNAVEQVKAFYDKTSVDGIILTKLDSTAKGGVVFSIINELNIPIKYIGIGEKIDDIKEFDAKEFVDSII
ncbi:MAG: signal recognition particle-docking protein FtsY [Clostridia bacterium]|nr:signal recognition particle-docking protein FtsY [Clostridia bacterium]